MILLACIIVAIVQSLDRKKLINLKDSDFPGVPPEKFEQWRCLVIKSIDQFQITIISVIAINVIILLISSMMTVTNSRPLTNIC